MDVYPSPSMRHMVDSAMDSWYMIFPSALIAWVLEYTGAHAEAFITWCVLSAADLVVGVLVAVVQGNFNVRRLYHWVEKTFVQLLSVFIFAAVLRTLAIASGVELFVANWLLLFYCFLDASSLLEKFVQMGWMPSVALVLLKLLRRRTTNAFAAMAGDPAIAAEMEQALVASPCSKVDERAVSGDTAGSAGADRCSSHEDRRYRDLRRSPQDSDNFRAPAFEESPRHWQHSGDVMRDKHRHRGDEEQLTAEEMEALTHEQKRT